MRSVLRKLSTVRSGVGSLLLIVGVCAFTAGAVVGVSWTKAEVIPVVLVKPGIGGFVPTEGIIVGNTWQKSDVRPVLLLKPGIGGFEPRDGLSIGNTWSKADVLPVVLVEPAASDFVPLHLLSSGGLPTADDAIISGTQSRQKSEEEVARTVSSAVIEDRIDGESDGWDGRTLVKLTNGQIWEQSEYYYHYRYAFMPKVLIYKSGGVYKMKIDGIERAVGVRRLK